MVKRGVKEGEGEGGEELRGGKGEREMRRKQEEGEGGGGNRVLGLRSGGWCVALWCGKEVERKGRRLFGFGIRLIYARMGFTFLSVGHSFIHSIR